MQAGGQGFNPPHLHHFSHWPIVYPSPHQLQRFGGCSTANALNCVCNSVLLFHLNSCLGCARRPSSLPVSARNSIPPEPGFPRKAPVLWEISACLAMASTPSLAPPYFPTVPAARRVESLPEPPCRHTVRQCMNLPDLFLPERHQASKPQAGRCSFNHLQDCRAKPGIPVNTTASPENQGRRGPA